MIRIFSFRKIVHQVLHVTLYGIVGELSGAGDKRQDAVIYAIAEGVLTAVDVDIVNTTGIVVQQPLGVDDRHAVDEHQRRQRTVVVVLFSADNEPRPSILIDFADAEHIFKQHLSDGKELTVLVEVIGQVWLCAIKLRVVSGK